MTPSPELHVRLTLRRNIGSMRTRRAPVLPVVTDVSVLGHWRLHLTFSDGRSGTADLSDLAADKMPLLIPLRDPDYFAKVRVRIETGTIEWPNGADLSREYLLEHLQPDPTSEQDRGGQAPGRAQHYDSLISPTRETGSSELVGRKSFQSDHLSLSGPPGDVVGVESAGPWRLHLLYADGFHGTVDLQPLIRGWLEKFSELAEPGYLAKVGTNRALGVIMWPNGAALDVGYLRHRLEQEMTGRDSRRTDSGPTIQVGPAEGVIFTEKYDEPDNPDGSSVSMEPDSTDSTRGVPGLNWLVKWRRRR